MENAKLLKQKQMLKARLNELVIRKEIKANNITVRTMKRGDNVYMVNRMGDCSWCGRDKVNRLNRDSAPMIDAVRAEIAAIDEEIIGGRV